MFGDKTIFFSRSPLLRDLTDTKSAPPPRGGVRNNGSRLTTALETQSLLRDNIVLKCAKDILPYIHVTLPAMSTEIDLVVVSTCLIRLLISTRVSGFPSTNSFLRSGSFLTTSSTFSWLFLKSSSWSRFKHPILSGREDSLLLFTYKHVRLINCRKISGSFSRRLWLKFSDRISASEKFSRRRNSSVR